jgi:hypothetical protein
MRITAIKIAFLGSAAFIALVSESQQPRDWNSEYQKLKSYDSEFAPRLKASDGSWIQPKPEISALLKKLGPEIQRVAKVLKVDPRAIAGAILAENSMNVGISDGAQDWLVKAGLAKNGKILGKSFTFGLGQLNFHVAREAEDYMAAVEKRKALSNSELEKTLLDPSGAIQMVGQVLRQAQDIYAKHGFDIAGKPEILTSVYNLGQPEQRAKAAKRENRQPRPNYFGFFVDHYLPKVESTIGYSKTPPAAAVAIAPAAKPKTEPSISAPKLVKRKLLSRSVALVQAPPSCQREGYGSDPRSRYESFKSFASVGVAERGLSWTLVSPGFDCEGQNWNLIRTEDGILGWAKEDDLEKNTVSEFSEASKCTSSTNAKCKAVVEKSAQKKVVQVDAKSKLTYLTPETGEGSKPNFKRQDWSCGQGAQGGVFPYQRMVAEAQKPSHSLDDLRGLLNQWQSAKKQGGDFTDPQNPFFGFGSHTQFFDETLTRCLAFQVAGAPCNFDIKTVGQMIQDLGTSFAARPVTLEKFDEISKKLMMASQLVSPQFMGGAIPKIWAASEEQISALEHSSALRGLKTCRGFCEEKSLKNSKNRIDRAIALIEGTNEKDYKTHRYNTLAADLIRFCSATVELMTGKPLPSTDQALQSMCDVKHGVMVQVDHFRVLNREFAKQEIERSMGLDHYMDQSFGHLMMGVRNQSFGPIMSDQQQDQTGYCPNLTAQYIEELLQNSKCIARIYVPDPWLVARLNAQGAKIIYRPFERDDVFAVDYTEVNCK